MVPRNAAAMRPRLPKTLVDNPLDISDIAPLPPAAVVTTAASSLALSINFFSNCVFHLLFSVSCFSFPYIFITNSPTSSLGSDPEAAWARP